MPRITAVELQQDQDGSSGARVEHVPGVTVPLPREAVKGLAMNQAVDVRIVGRIERLSTGSVLIVPAYLDFSPTNVDIAELDDGMGPG